MGIKKVVRNICAAALALVFTTGAAIPVVEDTKIDGANVTQRVYYDQAPIVLVLNASNAPTLEKAYERITSNRPAYSDITSLTVTTDNTSLNISDPDSEDVKFIKKLTNIKKIDISGATLAGSPSVIQSGVFNGLATLEQMVLGTGITTINSSAFAGCTSLHSINLDKVTSIKNDAFNGCLSLNGINTASLTELGSNAFAGCVALEQVNLAAVGNIEAGTFNGCRSLISIGKTNALREVKEDAFRGCVLLKEIDLSRVNNSIGAYAFYNCRSLAATGNMTSIPSIGEYAFYNCAALETADLTSAATLGASVFYGCAKLKEAKTGISLRTIPASAFEGCTALADIDLKRITNIQTAAFKGCSSLNNLDLSDAMSISVYAFQGCAKLDKVSAWPTLFAKIENNAFMNCAFDFSAGYPANTGINEHNAPAQKPALIFALAGGDTVSYKIGDTVDYSKLYTLKTASGADYVKLVADKPGWMGTTAEDIKVTPKIKQFNRDIDAIETSEAGVYDVTLTLSGVVGSNTNELKMTISIGGGFWKEENGKQYYYEGTAKKTGWILYKEKWYYLDPNQGGAMATGWIKVSSKWYFMESDGSMKLGWLQDAGNNYYLLNDGAMKVGWLKTGESWYYFSGSGAMYKGWLKDGGKWYYLQADGSMAADTSLSIDGKTYRFDVNGVMQ